MTTMNPADTSTWLPLDGLAPGFDANKAPHTTALSGREINLTAPNGTRIAHRFADDEVTWTYAPGEGDPTAPATDTDAYEAVEVDEDLFYVQFHHRYLPNEAVSLVIDLRAGRVLSIISEILPTLEPGRTRVVHHFGTATIDGAEASGAEAHPTTALIGRRVEWVYSTEHAYEHVYLSERWYSWQCLAGPSADSPTPTRTACGRCAPASTCSPGARRSSRAPRSPSPTIATSRGSARTASCSASTRPARCRRTSPSARGGGSSR